MKKLLLLAFVTFVSLTAGAQLKFGVKGGLDLTNYTANGTFMENMKGTTQTGYYVGPTMKFCPVSFVGVDVSALFEQRSVEMAGMTVKQQSILFPANLRIQIPFNSLLAVSVFGGPQIGFNLSGSKDISYKDQVKEWSWKMSNLSGNVGIGVILFKHIEITGSYNLGLGKTGEFKRAKLESAIEDIDDTRFNSWQIGMAVYF